MKTYSREWKCSAKRLRFARAWKNLCVCDKNLLAGMKMFRETLTFHETSRKILDIYVSAALFGCTGRFFVFWLWWEKVLGVTSLPTIHTSCAVVSIFWLRREIVFGYSVSKKDSYSVSLIERQTASKCVYFVRSNTLLLFVSLLSIYLLYQKDQ